MPTTTRNPLALKAERCVAEGRHYKVTNQATPSRALAEFLSREDRTGHFESILDALDQRLVPEYPPTSWSPKASWNAIEDGMQALKDLVLVFRAVAEAADIPVIETFGKAIIRTLIDRWVGVMAWMRRVLVYASRTSAESGVVGLTVVTQFSASLMLIVTGSGEDPFRLEIVSMTCTADLILLLLCQVDPQTQRHYDLAPDQTPFLPPTLCTIIQLLHIYLEYSVGAEAMQLRLRSTKASTRRTAIRFFIRRIEEIVAHSFKSNLAAAAKSYLYLVVSVSILVHDRALWHTFDLEDFIFKYTAALCTLTKKAETLKFADTRFWANVSAAIIVLVKDFLIKLSPNPSAHVSKLVEGGLLQCVAICTTHQQDSEADLDLKSDGNALDALFLLYPFMYLSKVYFAADARGDSNLWRDNHVTRAEAQREGICVMIDQALNRSHHVYTDGKNRTISLCSSLKHSTTSEGHAFDNYRDALKTCAGCHAVTYCSQECQKEDWDALHSKECQELAVRYREQKRDKSWISVSTRIDQIRLLESSLNKDMLLLPQALAQIAEKQEATPTEATEWPHIYRPDSFLCVFDFVGAANFHRSYSLNAYTSGIWSSSARDLWAPRLHQYVLDMEVNRDEILLVEGLFRFNAEKIMFTLLKMRYDPDGPEGARYTVLSSFCRSAATDITQSIDALKYSKWLDE
ncbi:hypothetical protein DFP72DRAFT_867982 [Ephemerocybe angulata]|uniref:phytol kinase n=1 Tax=Ephemerocybe angulata TaxID=980116 RepID=A0A8H6IHA1_9AGAR|nr:hypothetical protein DFP72DRAFT_867982 [Tulosesus angulatus]